MAVPAHHSRSRDGPAIHEFSQSRLGQHAPSGLHPDYRAHTMHGAPPAFQDVSRHGQASPREMPQVHGASRAFEEFSQSHPGLTSPHGLYSDLAESKPEGRYSHPDLDHLDMDRVNFTAQMEATKGPGHKHAEQLRHELRQLQAVPHRQHAERAIASLEKKKEEHGRYAQAIFRQDTREVAEMWGCDKPTKVVQPVEDLDYPPPPTDPHHTFYKDFPLAAKPVAPQRPMQPKPVAVRAQCNALYDEPLYAELRIRLAQRDDYLSKLGFLRRTVHTTNGLVHYLEKPAAAAGKEGWGGKKPTLVLLHGFGQEGSDMLANLFGTPAQLLRLPGGVRCLVPDGLGHGARKPHRHKRSFQDLHYSGYDVEAQAQDLESFLSAVNVSTNEKIDVLAYSTSAGAALSLGHRRPALNRLVLVNPALALAGSRCAEVRAGNGMQQYDTLERAAKMLLLSGFAESAVSALAPLILIKRQAEMVPERYWARISKAPAWDLSRLQDFTLAEIRSKAGLAANLQTNKASERPSDWYKAPGADAEGGSNQPPASKSVKRLSGAPHPVIGTSLLAAAGVKMLVLQGTKDLVVDPRTLEVLETPFVEFKTKGTLEVELLEGYGHFAHPEQPKENVLEPAYSRAADFFEYFIYQEQL